MSTFKDANRKFKKNWLIGGVIVAIIIIVIAVIALSPKHLDGKYSHTTTLLFVSSKDTMDFKGDKVTELVDGKKTNSGTYKISGDQLTMTINDYQMKATLSKDKKSFVIDSATGAANMAKGFKYTKSTN
ncbi:hypothetical protein [Levilactobacillus fujinensis]|uniref:Uncharacterized protein n=1 Tax=Levilactobacillus fujinensis TaxID=2486024 RepID=A0ABW1TFX7_9LACO|nr:hypothetical protein [Levilactobacillus fujinensis]